MNSPQIDMLDEIIVDNFAGGGGASTGIELATGRPVTIAINHDPDAILMHKTNHPYTEHYQASVWDEHPVLVFVGYADTMTGFITTSSYFCFDENPHWQWDGLVKDAQRTLFWMPLPAPPDRRPPEGEANE